MKQNNGNSIEENGEIHLELTRGSEDALVGGERSRRSFWRSRKKRGRREGGEREVKEFEEELLQVDRVTRVVKGGRRLRFRDGCYR